MDAVQGRKPGRALDIGMGQGRNAVFLATQGWDVTGFDPSTEAVRIAKANADKSGVSNVEFRKGEIESLPVDDNSIDVAISNCVLNLVPDKDRGHPR